MGFCIRALFMGPNRDHIKDRVLSVYQKYRGGCSTPVVESTPLFLTSELEFWIRYEAPARAAEGTILVLSLWCLFFFGGVDLVLGITSLRVLGSRLGVNELLRPGRAAEVWMPCSPKPCQGFAQHLSRGSVYVCIYTYIYTYVSIYREREDTIHAYT